MSCLKCNSNRIAFVTAKCSDCCSVEVGGLDQQGYVPDDIGIGGGDYIEFKWCLDCGQIQNKFPLPVSGIEEDISDEEVGEFYENHFSEGDFIYRLPPQRYALERANQLNNRFGDFVCNFVKGLYTTKVPSMNEFITLFRNS